MINVDFADVRTVMSEMGMAMMGSASASGEGRASQAAEAAVKSPLLENVDLKGARGVLVNITANDSLTLDEYYEVMNTIQSFTAEEATVIVGTAFDAAMGENLRVTMVATGLGNPVNARQAKPTVVVDNVQQKATGTYDSVPAQMAGADDMDRPTIWRNRRSSEGLAMMDDPGIDSIDIPAFLRKQAD